MKFLFNGLPYFGKKIVRDLAGFAPEHSFIYCDTYYSKVDQVKFACMLPFADLVYSMNGVSDPSGSMNLVLLLKKKLLMYWLGTDVLLATERSNSGTMDRKYIDYSRHFACAPWLTKELKEIQIESSFLPFNWVEVKKNELPFSELGVYTYLGEGKEDFYGWPVIRHLAKTFPDLNFYIAGSRGSHLEKSPNTIFLGWLKADEMEKLRNRVPVCIRFAKHDGISLAVTEAMAAGNEVIRNIDFEKCHYAADLPAAEVQLRKVISLVKARNLARNVNNMNFVAENYSKNKVLSNLLDTLIAVAKS